MILRTIIRDQVYVVVEKSLASIINVSTTILTSVVISFLASCIAPLYVTDMDHNGS